ncbi:MAG: glutamate--tRNA ligase, partial [Actinomycetota bacterium]
DLFLHRDRGFIHEGLLNYLALLGWSIGPDRDIFSLDEFIAAFDIENVNPNPARFDQKKAESINGDHIRMLDVKDFAERTIAYLAAAGLFDEPTHEQLVLAFRAAPLVQERVQLLGDVPGMLGFLFTDEISYDADALKGLPANAAEVLAACIAALEPVTEFTPEKIQDALATALVEKLELKPRVAYGPPRVAITGRRISPPLFESMELIGKEITLQRLAALVQALGA